MELNDRLKMYIELYEQPPFGHEVGGTTELLKEAFDRIAEYEDLEEQGLIVKLPCKVGDNIWKNGFGGICSYEVTGFSFGNLNEDYDEDDVIVFDKLIIYYTNGDESITGYFVESALNKTVFLTKEEAEAALEKMEGEKLC